MTAAIAAIAVPQNRRCTECGHPRKEHQAYGCTMCNCDKPWREV